MLILLEICQLLMITSSLFLLFIELPIFFSENYMVQSSANKIKREVQDALDRALKYFILDWII